MVKPVSLMGYINYLNVAKSDPKSIKTYKVALNMLIGAAIGYGTRLIGLVSSARLGIGIGIAASLLKLLFLKPAQTWRDELMGKPYRTSNSGLTQKSIENFYAYNSNMPAYVHNSDQVAPVTETAMRMAIIEGLDSCFKISSSDKPYLLKDVAINELLQEKGKIKATFKISVHESSYEDWVAFFSYNKAQQGYEIRFEPAASF